MPNSKKKFIIDFKFLLLFPLIPEEFVVRLSILPLVKNVQVVEAVHLAHSSQEGVLRPLTYIPVSLLTVHRLLFTSREALCAMGFFQKGPGKREGYPPQQHGQPR